MCRLDWKLVSTNTLSALYDGWAYTISHKLDNGWWQLCAEPIQDRGLDWQKWFEVRYLQDAMAIAQALAAGIEIE